jgi:hypothetical protein
MTCGESVPRSMVCVRANGCARHLGTLPQVLLSNNWGTLHPDLRDFPNSVLGLTDRQFTDVTDLVNDRPRWPWLRHCRQAGRARSPGGLNSRDIDRGGKES